MPGRRLGGDAGSATTEFVIATPAFLFTIMLIVQAGLYFHAVSIVSAAAQEGARTAAVAGEAGNVALGEEDAEQMVRELAPRLLSGVNAAGQLRDGNEVVQMTVEGEVTTVFAFPGMNVQFDVQESAETAIERFRPGGAGTPTDDTP